MKTWKAILGVVAVFVLGLMAGGLLTLGVVHRVVARGPDGWRDAIVRRLSWELRLDREQRAQLQTIVREAQTEIRAVNATVHPQVRAALDRAEDRVRDILHPNQRAKFAEIVAKHRATWDQ